MVGGEVCRQLRKQGKPVRALVRPGSNAEKVAALQALGCELATGDVRYRTALDAACQGVDTVISTISSMPFSWNPPDNTIDTVDRQGLQTLVDAAQNAGVSQFIDVTFSGNIDSDFPLRNAKRAVEIHLKQSGLRYTILRPSCFMEVWLGPAVGFDYANASATIYGAGHNPLSWISFADVGAFAVAAVGNPAAYNAVIELGGPEALSPLEAVAIFEELSGQHFAVQHVPEDALVQQQAAAPDDMQRSFAALMRHVALGDAIPMDATLRSFPVPLTSVRDYAARALGTAGASTS